MNLETLLLEFQRQYPTGVVEARRFCLKKLAEPIGNVGEPQ